MKKTILSTVLITTLLVSCSPNDAAEHYDYVSQTVNCIKEYECEDVPDSLPPGYVEIDENKKIVRLFNVYGNEELKYEILIIDEIIIEKEIKKYTLSHPKESDYGYTIYLAYDEKNKTITTSYPSGMNTTLKLL